MSEKEQKQKAMEVFVSAAFAFEKIKQGSETFVCLSRGNGKSGKILREVIERTGYLDE